VGKGGFGESMGGGGVTTYCHILSLGGGDTHCQVFLSGIINSLSCRASPLTSKIVWRWTSKKNK
jgi:hypothetical protein